MRRLIILLTVPLLVLSCAHLRTEADGLRKWFKYEDPRSLRNLQTKPIDVRYEVKHIYVNGKSMDAASAMKMLKLSRELLPVPDIVVSVRGRLYKSAIPFLKSISDAGLCDETRCWIKTVRSRK